MRPRPQVALLIETSNAYSRGLLRGIHNYLNEHQPWSIYLPERGRGDVPPNLLQDWQGEGIIARIENARIAKAIQAAGVPTVNVSATDFLPGVPCVETDNAAIARLVFDHLAQRGFQNFAFCGDQQFRWSREREQRFAEFARREGRECSIYSPQTRRRGKGSWEQEQDRLVAWLRALPKPCGMMSAYDICGWQVLEVCRRTTIRVPDEIAVVSVDNDELLSNLSDPPLSSVMPDSLRTGYLAAQTLETLMAGGKVVGTACLLPPTGLVTRESSDVRATDDADVALAMRFIREHACDGIKVADVLSALPPLSRRVLEMRFNRVVGHTPHDEILRLQLQRAQQLLEQTDLPLRTVADKAGFKHAEYLSVVFRQTFGATPGAYRADRR